MQQQQHQMTTVKCKSLASNHWAVESTHWQHIHSPTNFVVMGLKTNVSLQDLQKMHFQSKTESEAVGGKKVTRNLNCCFAPKSSKTINSLDRSILNYRFKMTNVAIKPVLNQSRCISGNQSFMSQLQWPMGLQYSPAQCDSLCKRNLQTAAAIM